MDDLSLALSLADAADAIASGTARTAAPAQRHAGGPRPGARCAACARACLGRTDRGTGAAGRRPGAPGVGLCRQYFRAQRRSALQQQQTLRDDEAQQAHEIAN